jgi:hypothetical protein
MGPDDADIEDYASAASSASSVLGSEASSSAAALLESLYAERAAVEELPALAARQELEADLHLAAAGARCAALECELLAAAAADAGAGADADPADADPAQRLAAERQDTTNRVLAAAGRMMAQLRSERARPWAGSTPSARSAPRSCACSIHARGLASAATTPRDACTEPASSATAAAAAPLAALADDGGVLALFLTRALGPPPAAAPAPSSAADLLRVFKKKTLQRPCPRRAAAPATCSLSPLRLLSAPTRALSSASSSATPLPLRRPRSHRFRPCCGPRSAALAAGGGNREKTRSVRTSVLKSCNYSDAGSRAASRGRAGAPGRRSRTRARAPRPGRPR